MTLIRPDAILFDWDNTLVDTWPTIHASLNKVLEAMGHEPWSMEKTQSEVKQSMRDSFPRLFGDRWEEAADLYQSSYREVHLEKLVPLEGAKATLDFLQDLPVFVGLVSNKKGPTLREEVGHLGWDAYFSSMVGAHDAPQDKPDPAPVTMALEPLHHMDHINSWFIGDSSIDMECAQNTGCTPILYGPVAKPENGKIEGFPIAHHSKDHDDLQRLLAQIFA